MPVGETGDRSEGEDETPERYEQTRIEHFFEQLEQRVQTGENELEQEPTRQDKHADKRPLENERRQLEEAIDESTEEVQSDENREDTAQERTEKENIAPLTEGEERRLQENVEDFLKENQSTESVDRDLRNLDLADIEQLETKDTSGLPKEAESPIQKSEPQSTEAQISLRNHQGKPEQITERYLERKYDTPTRGGEIEEEARRRIKQTADKQNLPEATHRGRGKERDRIKKAETRIEHAGAVHQKVTDRKGVPERDADNVDSPKESSPQEKKPTRELREENDKTKGDDIAEKIEKLHKANSIYGTFTVSTHGSLYRQTSLYVPARTRRRLLLEGRKGQKIPILTTVKIDDNYVSFNCTLTGSCITIPVEAARRYGPPRKVEVWVSRISKEQAISFREKEGSYVVNEKLDLKKPVEETHWDSSEETRRKIESLHRNAVYGLIRVQTLTVGKKYKYTRTYPIVRDEFRKRLLGTTEERRGIQVLATIKAEDNYITFPSTLTRSYMHLPAPVEKSFRFPETIEVWISIIPKEEKEVFSTEHDGYVTHSDLNLNRIIDYGYIEEYKTQIRLTFREGKTFLSILGREIELSKVELRYKTEDYIVYTKSGYPIGVGSRGLRIWASSGDSRRIHGMELKDDNTLKMMSGLHYILAQYLDLRDGHRIRRKEWIKLRRQWERTQNLNNLKGIFGEHIGLKAISSQQIESAGISLVEVIGGPGKPDKIARITETNQPIVWEDKAFRKFTAYSRTAAKIAENLEDYKTNLAVLLVTDQVNKRRLKRHFERELGTREVEVVGLKKWNRIKKKLDSKYYILVLDKSTLREIFRDDPDMLIEIDAAKARTIDEFKRILKDDEIQRIRRELNDA